MSIAPTSPQPTSEPRMRMTRIPVVRSSTVSMLLGLALSVGGCGGESSGPDEASADLSATLAGPASLTTTDTATYTVTLRNDGPDEATNVVASLELPTGMAPVAGEPVTVTSGRATWPALATLAAAGSVALTVRLTATSVGAGTLVARASGSVKDPQGSNNDGSASGARVAVTISMTPTATDLQVSFLGTLNGASGTTVGASIQVRNAGPLAAGNVTAVLMLPDGIAATNLVPAGGVRTAGRITWALGALAAGGTTTITLDLGVPLLSLTTLNATVASDTDEGVPGNNVASAALRAVVAAVYTLVGEANGDNFGWIARSIGDVNGDGREDVVITAPYNDAGGVNAGRGYVYSGASGQLLYMVTGDTPNGELGLSVDPVGDINGDGISDIAFGAPFASTAAAPGYVLVVSGSNGATLFRFGTSAITFAGYSVGEAGDLTADGVRDVLVGVPGRSPAGVPGGGSVFVVSGATGTVAAIVDGTVSNGLFGAGTRTLGDLNGDNIPDFAVGSSNEAGGRVRVYSGADGSLLFPAISVTNGGTLGQYWLFSPGDYDNDGIPDLFAADINNATGGFDQGQAYIFSGATGNRIRTFSGESPNDQFGMGRVVSDLTGDGVGDFVLAGWLRSEGAPQAGKMYVVDGATGATLRSLVSVVPNETLGFDVLGMGDVTGDGLEDYMITAGQFTGPGKAYLIAGVPLP